LYDKKELLPPGNDKKDSMSFFSCTVDSFLKPLLTLTAMLLDKVSVTASLQDLTLVCLLLDNIVHGVSSL